jgi:cytochrome c oxidase subunit 1
MIPFVESHEMRAEGVLKLFDTLWLWFGLAVVLVLLAYLPTLISMFGDQILIPGVVAW